MAQMLPFSAQRVSLDGYPHVEASVHRVVIEVPQEHSGFEPDVLGEQIVLAANGWGLECIASRQGAGDL